MENKSFDAAGKEIHVGDKVLRAHLQMGAIKWSEHTVTGICAKMIRVSNGRNEINVTPGNCVVMSH